MERIINRVLYYTLQATLWLTAARLVLRVGRKMLGKN